MLEENRNEEEPLDLGGWDSIWKRLKWTGTPWAEHPIRLNSLSEAAPMDRRI